MPRYFQSMMTARPFYAGGRSFIFEPVEPMGGSWAGVLAVDDESAASVLFAEGLEISEARYNELKKKRSGEQTPHGYAPSPTPPRLPPQPIVVSAARAADHTAFTSSLPQAPVVVIPPSVELTTTSKAPPVEPLLENHTVKRRKAA